MRNNGISWNTELIFLIFIILSTRLYYKKMSTCISCLKKNKIVRIFKCNTIGCMNIMSLCKSCYSEWRLVFISINGIIFSKCSIHCLANLVEKYINKSFFDKVPKILIEHQEEILHESRKSMVKSLIKELNYFINDILNEIMEY